MKSFLQFIQESTATQQAARLGLEGDGHGGWYKDGEFVAKTESGRLKFYNKRQRVGQDPKQSEKEKNLSSPNTQAPPEGHKTEPSAAPKGNPANQASNNESMSCHHMIIATLSTNNIAVPREANSSICD